MSSLAWVRSFPLCFSELGISFGVVFKGNQPETNPKITFGVLWLVSREAKGKLTSWGGSKPDFWTHAQICESDRNPPFHGTH